VGASVVVALVSSNKDLEGGGGGGATTGGCDGVVDDVRIDDGGLTAMVEVEKGSISEWLVITVEKDDVDDGGGGITACGVGG